MRWALGRSARTTWQELSARHAWRTSILVPTAASVLLLTLVVVVTAGSERATPRTTHDFAQAAFTPHSLPTVPASERAPPNARATPTPRVIHVAEPTPMPISPSTATAEAPSIATAPVEITDEAETLPTGANSAETPAPIAVATLPVITPSAPSAPAPYAFSAEDWRGGYYRGDGLAYGRPWVAVYGADSAHPRVSLSFTLEAAPVGEATLNVTGLDDEWAALNEITLEVNGQLVFAGPSPFVNWDGAGDEPEAAWTTVPFRIPAGTLRTGANGVVLNNRTPAANFDAPPYVLVADAALEVSVEGGEGPRSLGPTGPADAVAPVAVGAAAVIPAAAWDGALRPREPLHFGRPWVAIYGDQTVYARATVTVLLDTAPAGPATLTLTGVDDEWFDHPPMAVEVNRQQVFVGVSPFANWDGTTTGGAGAWTPVAITIAPELLHPGRNTITVANLAPTVTIGSPPYVLLGDATLQAPGATVTVLGDAEEPS